MTATLHPRRRLAAGAAVALAVALAGALALGVGAFAAAGAPPPLLVNESPSLPRGLYIRADGAKMESGRIVATPQPEAGRAYLASLGMPAEVLLIKRVAAEGGDRVCVAGDRLVLPSGERTVRRDDRRGVRLPRWAGCRRLGADELFLLGDTAGSFDSRYFGPVKRDRVLGVYTEVMTW